MLPPGIPDTSEGSYCSTKLPGEGMGEWAGKNDQGICNSHV